MNIDKKTSTFAVPVEKYKKQYPDCEEKFIKPKIETLRAYFQREMKKAQNSKKTRNGQGKVYLDSLTQIIYLTHLIPNNYSLSSMVILDMYR